MGYVGRYQSHGVGPSLTEDEHRTVIGNGSSVANYLNGILLPNGSTNFTYNAASSEKIYIGNANHMFNPYKGNIFCVYYYTDNQSANMPAIHTSLNNMLAIVNE